MKDYQPTVGLEIHAELNTRTKMFCACLNNPNEIRPNTNICPICMAHPGTLPVVNREAVRKVLSVGEAVGAKNANKTIFDRKNYFYPDIPKGYQISQYKDPLVSGGMLAGTLITRIHLEEDTARSSHEVEGSLVDFNRAGVPLMELVTEPVIHSAEQAGLFARELQLLLRYLGVSEANMEKGEMRVEANISVSPGADFGTKVEVKNLNSFRSVERAIQYEIKRQVECLEKGEQIQQETRGWDEQGQKTFPQRKKESSHDYRYFPEPDIPGFLISEIENFNLGLVGGIELPAIRRNRYIALGLRPEDADLFTRESLHGDFLDVVYGINPSVVGLAANYLGTDLAAKIKNGELGAGWLTKESSPRRFAALMGMVQAEELSSRGAKDALNELVKSEKEPKAIAESMGLLQKSDQEGMRVLANKVILANDTAVKEYRAGKQASMQFLVGKGMKESGGSANPAILRKVLEEILSS